MKKHIAQHRWMHLVIISAVLIATMGFAPAGMAQTACDTQYTVQRGDTLSSIARQCSTTVNALLRANPQITNPSRIFPGEQIYLPGALLVEPGTEKTIYIVKSGDYLSAIAVRFDATLATLLKLNPQITNPRLIFAGQRLNLPSGIIPITGGQAELEITPSAGQPGTQVTVSGHDFPAKTKIDLSISSPGAAPVDELTLKTNANGDFAEQLSIPSNAQAGSTWVITAAAQEGGSSAKKQFQVVAGPYSVQSGDTLAKIAQRFETTVPILLSVNPQITNPNRITRGEVINIPERISFPSGGTWAVATGKLLADSSQYYVLRAAKNQLLEANLAPEEGIRLSIYGVDGTVLKEANSGEAAFRDTLPSTQDYVLEVSAKEKTAYTMNVDVPARISFTPGTISGTVTGKVAAESSQYYILRALKNQKMEVRVAPQEGLQLVIYGVDGTVLKSGMSEAALFTGKLPRSQDYILVLTAGDQAVNFTMKVTIPSSVVPNSGQTIYIVQRGDSLAKIARRFGTTVNDLLEANPQIINANLIYPGERLVIP